MVRRRSLAILAALLFSLPLGAQERRSQHWVGTWATGLVARPVPPAAAASAANTPLHFNNQTLRQIVRVSIGGPQARVVFNNAFGTAPLILGAAAIALRENGAVINGTSSRPLTFSGRPSATVAPGTVLVSDPVTIAVPDLADVAVDMYLPGNTGSAASPLSHHPGPGFPIWSWYSPPQNRRLALISLGADARNPATKGDTLWVTKNSSRFSSPSTGF